MLQDWENDLLLHTHKNGDITNWESRAICMSSSAFKAYAKITEWKLRIVIYGMQREQEQAALRTIEKLWTIFCSLEI